MSKRKNIIILVLVFVLLIGGASVLYTQLSKEDAPDGLLIQEEQDKNDNESQSDSSDIGDTERQLTKSPDFTVYDAAGNKVNLSDYIGKPIVLNFWASWCGPCASEMPDIQSAWEEHGNDVEFVIVNMTDMNGETEQSAKAFLAENNYTFPCYFDANNSAATAFGVSSIPQTYLINAEGNIIGAYMGAMDASVIAQGIDMLTGNTAAPAAQ